MKHSSEYPLWLYDLTETHMPPAIRREFWKIDSALTNPCKAEVRLYLKGEKKRRLKMKLMQLVTKHAAVDDERQHIDEEMSEFMDEGYGPGQKRPYASDKDIPEIVPDDEEEGEEEG